MSQQAAHDFINSLSSDRTLAQKATELKGSTQAIVDLARERGYEFTLAELETVLPTPTDPPNRELTEAELDMAVGGSWTGYWTWTGGKWVWTWVWVNDSSSGWISS